MKVDQMKMPTASRMTALYPSPGEIRKMARSMLPAPAALRALVRRIMPTPADMAALVVTFEAADKKRDDSLAAMVGNSEGVEE